MMRKPLFVLVKALTVSVAVVLSGCSDELKSESQESQESQDTQPQAQTGNQKVVLYSARKPHLIKPALDAFTKETGIEVDMLSGKAGALLERLKSEGVKTPADILMTVDAGNLWQAAKQGVLAPVDSPILNQVVSSHMRDSQGRWVALSVRARAVVYSKERVSPDSLSSYEALSDQKWQGKLCLRTSQKVYNQSLVASMIHHLGEEQALGVVRGWVENLAQPVFSSDTALLKAIAAGKCDVGIVNTYYLGRLLKEDSTFPVAFFWSNQREGARGVHINISGAGIVEHAKHPKAAQQLLEWLVQPRAQALLAEQNLEYPVNANVKRSELLSSFGDFKQDAMPLELAGELQKQALMLMDKAGYQ